MRIRAATDVTRRVLTRQLCLAFAVVFAVCDVTGCTITRNMFAGRQRDPMAGAPRLRNFNDPPLDELVAHLNDNTNKIESWRADNVSIRTNGLPLTGKLAVEKNRHVRMFVTSPLGNEVDLGSNDDRFWVWSRRMEPAFVTCKHENMEVARQKMGIPFEPDWLMQALGVAALPTSDIEIQRDRTHEHARLIQQVTSAHGLPLRRVVLVDLNKGKGVVIEHSLYDYNGNRVALAKLSGHKHDRETGVVLPHRVLLELPQHQMSMTMDLGKIQINPKSIPSQIWAMPEMAGYQVVNLDDGLDSLRVVTHTELNERTRLSEGIRPIGRRTSDDQGDAVDDKLDTDTSDESMGRARLSFEEVEQDASKADEQDWEK